MCVCVCVLVLFLSARYPVEWAYMVEFRIIHSKFTEMGDNIFIQTPFLYAIYAATRNV